MERWNGVVAAVVGIAMLLAGPFVQLRVVDGAHAQLEHALPLPDICSAATEWAPSWRPRFAGADVELASTWRCDGLATHVFVAQYATQAQGKEAVNELNQTTPPALRRVAERSTRRVGDFDVIEWDAHGDASFGGETVWSWYAVGDRTSVSGIETKLYEALNAMRFRSETTTVVVLAVDSPTTRASRAVLDVCANEIRDWLRSA